MVKQNFINLIQESLGGFTSAGCNFEQVTRTGLNLPMVSSSASTPVNMLSLHKITDYLSKTADVSNGVITIAKELHDYGREHAVVPGEEGEDTQDLDIVSAYLQQMADILGINFEDMTPDVPYEYDLFQVNGYSPKLLVTYTLGYQQQYPGIYFQGALSMQFGLVNDPRFDGHAKIEFIDSWRTDVIQYLKDDVTTYVTGVAYEASLYEATAANDCCQRIIECASRTGEIAASDAIAICDTFDNSATVATLKSYLAGQGKMQGLSVVTVIAHFLKGATGGYNEGDNHFTPVATPSFSFNIIGTIVSAAISILSVVLAVVFRSLQAVIALLGFIFSTVVDLLRNAFTGTNASVKDWSDLPSANYPVFTYKSGRIDLDISDLQDYGSLSIDDPHSGLVYLILPANADYSEYFVQGFMRPTQSDTGGMAGYRATLSDLTYDIATGKTTGYAGPASREGMPTFRANNTSYYSLNYNSGGSGNVELGLNLLRGISKMCQDVYDYEVRNDHWDPSDVEDFTFSMDGYTGVTSGDPTALFAGCYSRSVHSALCFIRWWSIVVQLYYNPIYITVPGQANPLPVTVNFYRNYDTIVRFLAALNDESTPLGMSFHTLIQMWTGTQVANDNSLRGVGAPLLNSNVEWPSFSYGSAIMALVVSALAAVAVTATVVSVKQWRKRRAVKRLALQEVKFNDAQAAFLDNPKDKKAAKNFVKQNRKLGRAWSKAGAAGVSSYNGFDTGSSTAQVSEYSDILEAAKVAETADQSESPENLSLDEITKLISGT